MHKSLIFLVFVLAAQGAFSYEGYGKLDWLELDQRTNAPHWKKQLNDKGRVLIFSPAWKKNPESLSKKILGLVPKKSSSYLTAVNVLLQTLRREKIYAQVSIYNFSGKHELALKSIENAEKNGTDFIFSMGSDTASFFFEKYRNTKIPVVTAITKDPVTLGWVKDYETGSKINIASTSLNVHPNILVNYILDMIPDLKNVVLLYEEEHDQVKKTEVEPLRETFHRNRSGFKINVMDLNVEKRSRTSEILRAKLPKVVARLEKSDTRLKRSIFLITSSTTVFSNIALINRYSKNIPVISLVPNIVTEGDDSALIAIGIDRRNNAQIASNYAVDILKGIGNPGDMPVGIVFPPDVAISFKIAKKIDIKIPYRIFEGAAFIYDSEGRAVRAFGEKVDITLNSEYRLNTSAVSDNYGTRR